MGAFQYFLLYICPAPGIIAERMAAFLGLKTLICEESFFVVSPFILVMGMILPAVSFTMTVSLFTGTDSFFCAIHKTGITKAVKRNRKAFIMRRKLICRNT